MANVKLVAAECPSCGASLKIPEGLEKAHCVCCGTQVFLSHKRVKCKAREGLGKLGFCRACDGRGRCTWETHSAGGRDRELLMLGYSAYCVDGTCSACGGTGKYLLGGCPGCGEMWVPGKTFCENCGFGKAPPESK